MIVCTKSLKVAVFDLDGTLVSSDNAIYRVLNKALAELGKDALDFNILRQSIGMDMTTLLHKNFPDENTAFYSDMTHLFEKRYHEAALNKTSILCYPYIKEQLAKLNEAGWVMAVCTGASRKSCEKHLIYNDIHSYFVTLKTATDGYPSKPDPQILRAAIQECGGEVNHAVMIGDTTYDIEMATKIQMKSIGVLWGYHDQKSLQQAKAYCTLQSPQFLFETLERIVDE